VGAGFNIICLILSFIFPAKNRAQKAVDGNSSGGGIFGCCRGGSSLPITADSTPSKDVGSVPTGQL
jgi:hypothetical protein